MAPWRLVDGRAPVDSPEAMPSVKITSDAQLRQELGRLQQLEPALVSLESPRGKALQLGIGGHWAGIRYYPSPGKSTRHRVVLADPPGCTTRIDFAAEEDTVAFFPESVLPVADAIEIAVHFFTHQELPDSVSWKEWDPSTRHWQVHRAATVSS